MSKKTVSKTSVLGRFHRKFVMGRRTSRIADEVSKILPTNVSLLDVGAGNGYLAREVLHRRPDLHVEGIDILTWPEQVIKITQYDGSRIPFGEGEWDYCMACDVLHHCQNPSALLREMARVSRVGIVVKDHIADSACDYRTLCFLDWMGNRGHGVGLTYNYLSSKQWEREFEAIGTKPEVLAQNLRLYPIPFTWVFDRRLQFVALCPI